MEIPIIVYTYKDVVVKYEESEVFGDIDDIIDKYTLPFDTLYQEQKEEEEKENQETMMNTPSMPVQSILPSLNLTPSRLEVPQLTEVELAYSDFPE